MRVVVVGANAVTSAVTQMLIKRGHDVVVVDDTREKLDKMAEDIDCGLVHGDATSPEVLKEAAAGRPDVLLGLTDSDQTNILSAVLGRTVGFERVIPRVSSASFITLCDELQLDDTIRPDEAVAQHLVDSIQHHEAIDFSAMIEGDVRLFGLSMTDGHPRNLSDLDLPKRAMPICVYRDGDFIIPKEEISVKDGDRIIIITDSDGLKRLKEEYASSANHNDQ